MSAELIAILSVGATLFATSIAILTLGWFAFSNLDAKIERNAALIAGVQADVAELSGYVRGLHKMDLAEDEDR